MKNRHLLAKLLAAVFVIALVAAACGGDDTDAANPPVDEPADAPSDEPVDEPADAPADEPVDEPADEPAGDDEIVIGFSQASMDHPWRIAMADGNLDYAEENYPDARVIFTDGEGDANKQTADVESLLAQDIDVLMISPFSDALAPIVEQAMEQGIPVVTMDRRVPTEVAVHVGAENLPIGRQAGEFLVEQNTDARCIEVQGGAANSAALGRHDGFAEGIAGSNVEIVATTNVEDWGREGSVAFVEDQLQRFGSGEIDCVYAHNDEMALGAALAIEDAGRSGEFVIIGVDGQNSAIQAVADGTLGATFVYPFVAPEGVITAYEVATGTYTGDAEYVLPGAAIFADNVDEWIGKGFG